MMDVESTRARCARTPPPRPAAARRDARVRARARGGGHWWTPRPSRGRAERLLLDRLHARAFESSSSPPGWSRCCATRPTPPRGTTRTPRSSVFPRHAARVLTLPSARRRGAEGARLGGGRRARDARRLRDARYPATRSKTQIGGERGGGRPLPRCLDAKRSPRARATARRRTRRRHAATADARGARLGSRGAALRPVRGRGRHLGASAVPSQSPPLRALTDELNNRRAFADALRRLLDECDRGAETVDALARRAGNGGGGDGDGAGQRRRARARRRFRALSVRGARFELDAVREWTRGSSHGCLGRLERSARRRRASSVAFPVAGRHRRAARRRHRGDRASERHARGLRDADATRQAVRHLADQRHAARRDRGAPLYLLGLGGVLKNRWLSPSLSTTGTRPTASTTTTCAARWPSRAPRRSSPGTRWRSARSRCASTTRTRW